MSWFPFLTDAVFTVDDDVVIDCGLLTAAFSLWCKGEAAGKPSVVGFEPRSLDLKSKTPNNPSGYEWNSSCRGNFSFNAVWITKGALLHWCYYAAYWGDSYSDLRSSVDRYLTGEDMLMSAILMLHQVSVIVVHPAAGYRFKTPRIPLAVKDLYTSLGQRSSAWRQEIRKQIRIHISNQALRDEPSSQWYIVQSSENIETISMPRQNMKMRCSN